MARAKRTERAEARRRYRAATADESGVDEIVDAPGVPTAARPRVARDPRPAAPSRAAATPRPGFMGALRASSGPVDIRGDLRALPDVILKSRAGWLPALVIGATTIAMVVPSLGSNAIVAMAGNVILQPPPMIIAFLAGMMAPRAAWLMGGIMSLLASVAYLFIYFSRTDISVTSLGFTVTISPADKLAVGLGAIPMSLLSWVIFGIAIGAFAGFYRRFLRMSVPESQGARRR